MVTISATDAARGPQIAAPCVVVDQLAVARAGRVVLRVPILEVSSGQLVAIVGPNGSGKSTLLHAIAGLISPAAGSVTVLDGPADEAHGAVAYVLQSQSLPSLLPVTVEEVVGLAAAPGWRSRGPRRARVAGALARMDIEHLRHRRMRELSGGQRQRVLVAQGLAQEAPVLLLDEPDAGLDLPAAELVRAVLRDEAAAGRAVVVATHRLTDAALADHVVVLAGRVVASGPPEEALRASVLADAYGGHLLQAVDGAVLLDEGSHHHDDDSTHHHDIASNDRDR